MKTEVPQARYNIDKTNKVVFVSYDFFGAAGTSIISRTIQGTKRERKTAYNDLVRLAKVCKLIAKDSDVVYAGPGVDAAGNLGILFLCVLALSIGGTIE